MSSWWPVNLTPDQMAALVLVAEGALGLGSDRRLDRDLEDALRALHESLSAVWRREVGRMA